MSKEVEPQLRAATLNTIVELSHEETDGSYHPVEWREITAALSYCSFMTYAEVVIATSLLEEMGMVERTKESTENGDVMLYLTPTERGRAASKRHILVHQ